MIAEILSVGTELLLGQIVNTDAMYLARRLSEAGITLHFQTTVGDNPGRLRETLELALSRSDIVITTGGLGPTADDITKELSAAALDLPMEHNAQAETQLRNWFARGGFQMTDNNLRQAQFASGAILLENHHGTAPGCIVECGDKTIINLPGPPRELYPMFDQSVMPYLARRSGTRIVSRYLRIYGMGESMVESTLSDIIDSADNPTIATYCQTGEVQLRLTMRCEKGENENAHLNALEAKIRTRLPDVIYEVSDNPRHTMEQTVVHTLASRGLTVSTAESCTGGMIASRLINVPGASDVMGEGFVTYANEAKMRTLHVREHTLVEHGAVSEETAREMAEGLYQLSGADICLSVTGIAGPEGGTADKPVGLVWFALCVRGKTQAMSRTFTGDRERVRTLATLFSMDCIRRAALLIQ